MFVSSSVFHSASGPGDQKAKDATESNRKKLRICLFGNFGTGNFGNESTLEAILHNLRVRVLGAEFICICTGPDAVAKDYNVKTVPVGGVLVRRRFSNPIARLMRRIFIGIPSELCRWFQGFVTLWGTEALIIPGTGLLTDAFGLFGWGPYDMFRWCLIAKICRCKLLFVSVGAGPIYSSAGRLFAKAALSLADFRSYRDEASRQYLNRIGFRTESDQLTPDLVFSLPSTMKSTSMCGDRIRPVVGIGLMEYAGRYSSATPKAEIFTAYLEALADFAQWLVVHGYDIRLLIGDVVDQAVVHQFERLLTRRLPGLDENRILNESPGSFQDLLAQFAITDFVVATRFHNVLFSLLLDKPVIAISFHHKCAGLMKQMDLSEYCHDLDTITSDTLISSFRNLEAQADKVKAAITSAKSERRHQLDQLYNDICGVMIPFEHRKQEINFDEREAG
jgi:polysaccharide pyruvyl transferase WcaK-like protein